MMSRSFVARILPPERLGSSVSTRLGWLSYSFYTLRLAPTKIWERHQPGDCSQRMLSTTSSFARRKKPEFSAVPKDSEESEVEPPAAYHMSEPYQHGEASLEDYLKKASLSPWAPLPETAFRKYFDLAVVEPGDVHVDLGSGDGRINFHAIDYAGVAKSIGVEVDETIHQLALQRLQKRHPRPTNIEFHIADLMDSKQEIWDKIREEGTIITMFFAQEALKRLRPILERKLAGKKCRILTAGYPMPTWNPSITEVVLGTQIHLYRWNFPEDEYEATPFFTEDDASLIHAMPDELLSKQNSNSNNHKSPLEDDPRFKGHKVIDHTLTPFSEQERCQEFFDRCDIEDEEEMEHVDFSRIPNVTDPEMVKLLKEIEQNEQDGLEIDNFWKPGRYKQ